MAKDHSSEGYVIIESANDTLWHIAEKYLGNGSKYKELATINKITLYKRNGMDVAYLTIGQKIYLNSAAAGGSPGSSPSSSSSSNMCTITHFGVLSTDDKTLYATWTWGSPVHTASYKVAWYYTTVDGLELVGNVTNITVDDEYPDASRQATYQIPDDAVSVKFRVKPISKEVDKDLVEKVKDVVKTTVGIDTKEVYYVAEWTAWKTYTVASPLDAPGQPTVEIDKYKLTASLSNLDTIATHVQFQIVKDNDTVLETTSSIAINKNSNYVSYSRTVAAGHEYTVRVRAVKGALYSEWSPFSNAAKTMPAIPGSITVCRANSETSVYLEWTEAGAAKTYDIEYTTKFENFDNNDQTSSKTGIEFTHFEVTGLESGEEYFFRVRAVNEGGSSEWSEVKSVVVGSAPSAPTTWSSATTIIAGELLTLYWVHNSKDGSSQVRAEVEVYIDGVQFPVGYIPNSTDEDEKDKTSSLVVTADNEVAKELIAAGRNVLLLDRSVNLVGAKFLWRVRTQGIVSEFGEWSIQRTVDIYAPPTLDLTLLDAPNGNAINTLTSFPFYVYAIPGPETQKPIGYHLAVTANSAYDIADEYGNVESIGADGLVYSKYFDVNNDALLVELSAHNISLKNNITYTVTCTASMDSGLTAEASADITVAWTEVAYTPNAELSIDQVVYAAYIRPYCNVDRRTYRVVTYKNGAYTVGTETIDSAYGEPIPAILSSEYHWTRTTLSHTDGSFTTMYGVGEAGVSSWMGKTAQSRSVTYQKTSTNLRIPSGEWLGTIPSISSTEYLWIKTVETFTNGDTYTTYTVNPKGMRKLDSSTVNGIETVYQKHSSNYEYPNGEWLEELPSAKTTTGEQVLHGATVDGDEVYFCEVIETIPITDALFSVYRREFDGSFKEIAKDLDAERNVTVTDPHPALDYARYRIVATSKDTGTVCFYDMPAHPVGGKAAILQWDEAWTNFDTTEDSIQVQPPWEGSLLRLPYNIDVTDNSKPDVELVNYIGRSNPVSYYGTQTGKTSTWTMAIEKRDKETLYALRRLSNWMGDVYVREPSGSGYWANVTVSYNQKHKAVTIPVTLTITRVEGGA